MHKMYNFHVTRRVNSAELGHSIIQPHFSETKPCALEAERLKTHTPKKTALSTCTNNW